MKYDSIILELFDRVKNLEKEVEHLKLNMQTEDSCDFETEDSLSRFEAREKVMAEIEKRYSDYTVSKASRAEGSGIRIQTFKRIEPYRVKFYHSKLHQRGHAWHSININEIVDLSYVIFSMVDADNKFQVFIYTSEQVMLYNANHRNENDPILHLYLTVTGTKAFETREEHIDVSAHLNNWEVLSPENLID